MHRICIYDNASMIVSICIYDNTSMMVSKVSRNPEPSWLHVHSTTVSVLVISLCCHHSLLSPLPVEPLLRRKDEELKNIVSFASSVGDFRYRQPLDSVRDQVPTP